MATIFDKKGNIEHTRGDILPLGISTTNDDGSDYIFKVGDVVRFSIYKQGDCSCVELQKDVVVNEATKEVLIDLTKEDTRIGELISEPVVYNYEVELNPDTRPQTIIGYTLKDGAKLFTLTPEAGNKND